MQNHISFQIMVTLEPYTCTKWYIKQGSMENNAGVKIFFVQLVFLDNVHLGPIFVDFLLISGKAPFFVVQTVKNVKI